ncbi:MAG: formylglycine-generating enzyme family protein [Bacteroidia bacterium]|nr:formylglycine-generating enzyme family protein [Bacteroidia bacterium]
MRPRLLNPSLSLATLDQHMVRIEGGSFEMGSDSEESNANEKPIHTVRLDTFALCRYPVTQGLWREVMGADPERLCFTGADRPVEDVSWDDCQVFIQSLNALTGLHYRLPTEAEWEYATRGGKYSQGFDYSGSADLDEVGWYADNSYGETQPVGLHAPNALGLYDMSGNVWEWCQDWYGITYYANSPSDNPLGPAGGASRVRRGGSWLLDPVDAHVSFRSYWHPFDRFHYLGFRLARSL